MGEYNTGETVGRSGPYESEPLDFRRCLSTLSSSKQKAHHYLTTRTGFPAHWKHFDIENTRLSVENGLTNRRW